MPTLKVTVVEATGLVSPSSLGSAVNAFAKVHFNGSTEETSTISDNANPNWNVTFSFDVTKALTANDSVEIEVMDSTMAMFSNPIGSATVKLSTVSTKGLHEASVPLQNGKNSKGSVKFKLEYDGVKPADASTDGGAAPAQASAAANNADDARTDGQPTVGDTIVDQLNPNAFKGGRAQLSTTKQNYLVRVHIIKVHSLPGKEVDVSPFVRLQVAEQHAATNVVESKTSATYDRWYDFKFKNRSPRELFPKLVRVDVFNQGFLYTESRIGSFVLELGRAYEQPDHQYFRRFFQLYDQNDLTEAKGYIQMTIVVLGPGDEQVQKDVPPGGDSFEANEDNLIRHSGVNREPQVLKVSVFRGEHFPQLDADFQQVLAKAGNWFTGSKKKVDGCDPYVKVTFAGVSKQTHEEENTFDPLFNESMKFPMYLPSTCQYIDIAAFDSDFDGTGLINEDDLVGRHKLDLNQISASGEPSFPPRFGPAWVNLYGSPREWGTGLPELNPYMAAHIDKMDQGVIEGAAYRGRVYIRVDSEKAAPNEVIADAPVEKIRERVDFPKSATFKVRITFQEGYKMDKKTKYVSLAWGLDQRTSERISVKRGDNDSTGSPNAFLDLSDGKPTLEVSGKFEDDDFLRMNEYNEKRVFVLDCMDDVEDLLFDLEHDGKIDKRAITDLAHRMEQDFSTFVGHGSGSERNRNANLEVFHERHWVSLCAHYRQTINKMLADPKIKPEQLLAELDGITKELSHAASMSPHFSMPDVFIYTMDSSENVLAFARLNPADLLFPGKAAHGTKGVDTGWPRTHVLKSVMPVDEDEVHYIPGILQVRGYCSYVDTKLPDVSHAKPMLYHLRAHLYHAKDLPAVDDNGTADPFVTVTLLHSSKKSDVQNDTTAPLFDQTLELPDIELTRGRADDNLVAPKVVVEMWDNDGPKFGIFGNSPDFLGRCFIRPDLPEVQGGRPRPPTLQWYDLERADGKKAGKLLAAFELIPDSEIDDHEPVRDHGMVKTVRPETRKATIDIFALGVRGLHDQSKVTVKFECAGESLETNSPIMNTDKNPNFPENTLQMTVDLPVKSEYLPCITIKARAKSMFGQKLLGYHAADLEHTDRGVLRVIPSGQRQKKSKQLPRIAKRKSATDHISIDILKPGDDEEEEDIDEDDDDWWTRFYAAQKQTNDGSYKGPKPQILTTTLESYFRDFEDVFNSFSLHSGDAIEGEQSRVGAFKGKFKLNWVNKGQKSSRNVWEGYPKSKDLVTNAKVRVYFVRGVGLVSKDGVGSKSDAYPIASLGNQHKDLSRMHVNNSTDPYFGNMIEFDAQFPRDNELTVGLMDADFGRDNLIGECKIDIENRWLSRYHGTVGIPNAYDRTLWRETDKPAAILKKICDQYGIKVSHLDRAPYSTTITVRGEPDRVFTAPEQPLSAKQKRFKSTRGAKMDPEWGLQASSLAAINSLSKEKPRELRDVLKIVPEHVETRTLGTHGFPDQGKLMMWVDVIPLPAGSSAPPAVDITPRQPGPLELRVIVHGCRKVKLDETTLTGDTMSDIFVRCRIDCIDKERDTDTHYRSMNGEGAFNWRMKFPFNALMAERKIVIEQGIAMNKTLVKKPPILTCQVWDDDLISFDDYLGSVNIDLGRVAPYDRQKKWGKMFSKKEKPKTVNLLRAKAKKRQIRGEFRCTPSGSPTDKETSGIVDLTLEVLTKDEADKKRNGNGREEPNEHPVLQPPVRPEDSFLAITSPWKTFRYIIWRKYKWYIIGAILLALLIYGGFIFVTEYPELAAQYLWTDKLLGKTTTTSNP